MLVNGSIGPLLKSAATGPRTPCPVHNLVKRHMKEEGMVAHYK